ncbi:RDD family protein [Nonomuraea sp. NPDC048916]|uniref:RDD family protein n=1 Tax=Nonomuraea sp. NPDC048916 TaxID=3154232 RepID=UPI0033C41B1F
MSEVVTGDAVVVEVRVAQMPTRAVALAIDMALQLTVLIGAFTVLEAFSVISDPAMFAAVAIVAVVLVTVGYPVIFESLSGGRSLGKLALGLRVVSDDGSPERFRQALFRGLAGLVEFWMFSGAPALISSLFSQRGKRLGDIFAGTIVISDRGPREAGQVIWMPPPLAAWAATLELSQLPDEVAAAARQYIIRWHQLSPQIQHDMGVRIATQVAAFVSPAAPPGVPPHAYLSAVLAERRRRDQVRLAQRAGHGLPAASRPGPPPGGPQPWSSTGRPPPAPSTSWPPAAPSTGRPPGGQAQGVPAAPYAPPGQSRPLPEPPRATPDGFAPPQ